MKKVKDTIISSTARAKVNLALHVTGTTMNGLHDLDSLVCFPDIGDFLEFKLSRELSLKIDGPFGLDLKKTTDNSENIVIRAAKLMTGLNCGVTINLTKNLPLAAGIGGGSSDAATTLKVLSRLLNKSLPKMSDILSLGADVPVCISNDFQRMQGTGEKLTKLSKPPEIWIVLVNPGLSVPTKKIFDLLRNKTQQPLEYPVPVNSRSRFFSYLGRQRNDLEQVTCLVFPKIRALINDILKTSECQLARMSGSGSTCFGLYSAKNHADMAAKQLKMQHPRFWVQMAPLFRLSLKQQSRQVLQEDR